MDLAHSITVAKLINLLLDLDDNAVLIPNRVGNLAVMDASGEYIGYINLLEGLQSLEIFPERENAPDPD